MAEKVELTADLIYGFTGSVLAGNFDEPVPIPACHREWWELCCGSDKRVAIAAPRGHAKTTAITKSFTLAAVLFRARRFVVIVSDTYKQAVFFLGLIKNELNNNEHLKSLFGIKEFITDREDDIVVEMEDRHQFRIMAVGSEQKIRGLNWNDIRPDLVVGDDMENDEMVMNPERREKFMRWVNGALLPALSPKGIIRLIGTILHLDSFLENLMPKNWDKNTIRTDLKDYSVEPIDGWKSVRYRAHNEDFSAVLWPDRFSRDTLIELRQVHVKRGIPDVYSQEYLNYPLDPTRAYFKKQDFIDFSPSNHEEIKQKTKPLAYYIAIDPAISKDERADYTAVIICGMDSDGFLYMVDAMKDRIDAREQIDLMFTLYEKYEKLGGCEFIAIEKEKITQALGPFIREEMLKRQRFPQIIEIPHGNKDLEMRARSWQGRMRIGSVKFDKSADWYPIYESEMTTFPRGVKDDYVSASAILGLALDKMIEAPTSRELAELEYEEEYKLYMGHETDGRCASTGY